MSFLKKHVFIIVLCCVVIAGVVLWFVPVGRSGLVAGCSSKIYYSNIYGHFMYMEVVFAECGKPPSSIYSEVIWRSDSLGRFHGIVDGEEVVFDSYDELHTAVLNAGKDEFGVSHGWGGYYYWDEVEKRWVDSVEKLHKPDGDGED